MSDSDALADGKIVAGKIAGCYGIKGWVKIHAFTDPVENFLGFGERKVKRRDGLESIEFDAGRRQGKGLVAHIAGVDDRTQAEAYSGLEVAVSADSLPTLEEGDYYWSQLQGLQVWCREEHESDGEGFSRFFVQQLIAAGDATERGGQRIDKRVSAGAARIDIDAQCIQRIRAIGQVVVCQLRVFHPDGINLIEVAGIGWPERGANLRSKQLGDIRCANSLRERAAK